MFYRVRSRRGAPLIVVLTLGTLAGCYETRPKLTTAATQGHTAEDRVGIDDVFDVRVYGEPELSGSYRIATDGTIDYPLAGRLSVNGLRSGEVQRLLVSKLKDGGFIQNPQVTVTVKERNSQKIAVFGQVTKPGQVAYYPNM